MGRPKFDPLRDLISGAIMAATSVPQLVAYAETVGYAGWRGLATAGPPLLMWGLVTGSPFMNAGVTAITALMSKSDLDGESYLREHGEEAYVELVAAYSMYCGIASVVLAVLGFAKLAGLVPKPVRTGFKWGCAVSVLTSALPNGLYDTGASQIKSLVASNGTWNTMIAWIKINVPQATGAISVMGIFYSLLHPWEWAVVPAIVFVVGTWFIMNGQNLLPKFLPPGTEVILVTALTTWYSMNFDYSGGVVGEIPTLDAEAGILIPGTNGWRFPVEIMDYRKVLNAPLAESIGGWHILAVTSTLFAAVNFLSIMGIASGFESENGISWSPDRELVAQGLSCGVAALVGSAPVSGSLSRSLVSRMTGTTSQLACILTAFIWILAMPYMSIMSSTPKAALSAVIVSAVVKGVCLPKDLMKLQGINFLVGWGTGIVTALLSPTLGFGIGLIFYVLSMPFQPKQTKSTKQD
ncbi:sulfate transporter [Nitzschia inconspicua]|uniref:Sulfate transporter n=1 Tax=Nitzschia inconspicua TaxID=303405 RepID=A0A9K3PLT7_9STRA|nr:sulfate transporter [Nitzschia inconspicua]KAG7352137.1 sulfate transporter [Nitzschia inconspicua]